MPSQTTNLVSILFKPHLSTMLKHLNKKLKCLYSRLRWPIRRRPKTKISIKQFGKIASKPRVDSDSNPIYTSSATVHPNGPSGGPEAGKPIRLATFNAALFSMAPAVSKTQKGSVYDVENAHFRSKSTNDQPKSILKPSPLHPNSVKDSDNLSKQQKIGKSKLRVSINLPDNEISLLRNRQLSCKEDGGNAINRYLRGKAPILRSTSVSFHESLDGVRFNTSSRSIAEVLGELDVDILALQDVKAEEQNGMSPLSDLAAALGMNYVFAESWAPEYGNAILSKWPIKRSKVQKIVDDTDFRNILKATIVVPNIGEVEFHCTHLDHLDENWRMKQINSIIQSSDVPHLLAGSLNTLEETDYSSDRWTDIVKYYEEIGKPTPKTEVMRFLKNKQYTDAKDFAGECESVVIIAKGQSVQGTCKYGTRVDYVLASPDSPYKFVPGSYSVFSSKGTSDHHIVRVDVVKADNKIEDNVVKKQRKQRKQKVVKITANSHPSKGIWKVQT